MKYIKVKNKYYKVEKELTLEEVNEYKKTLQEHLDTIEVRRQEWAKIEKEKVVKEQEKVNEELIELNNLK